jgi:hypothetical protein
MNLNSRQRSFRKSLSLSPNLKAHCPGAQKGLQAFIKSWSDSMDPDLASHILLVLGNCELSSIETTTGFVGFKRNIPIPRNTKVSKPNTALMTGETTDGRIIALFRAPYERRNGDNMYYGQDIRPLEHVAFVFDKNTKELSFAYTPCGPENARSFTGLQLHCALHKEFLFQQKILEGTLSMAPTGVAYSGPCLRGRLPLDYRLEAVPTSMQSPYRRPKEYYAFVNDQFGICPPATRSLLARIVTGIEFHDAGAIPTYMQDSLRLSLGVIQNRNVFSSPAVKVTTMSRDDLCAGLPTSVAENLWKHAAAIATADRAAKDTVVDMALDGEWVADARDTSIDRLASGIKTDIKYAVAVPIIRATRELLAWAENLPQDSVGHQARAVSAIVGTFWSAAHKQVVGTELGDTVERDCFKMWEDNLAAMNPVHRLNLLSQRIVGLVPGQSRIGRSLLVQHLD